MLGQSQTLVMGFSQQVEGSPTKAAKQEDRSSCLPTTIRALEIAVQEGGDEFKVHGVEHGMLCLVGLVESITKQAASMELSLSDGTGRIKARYYVTETPLKELDNIVAGRYISAFGNMRTSPAPHFVMTGMRLVQSADEISYHMIESAHAALKLKQGVISPEFTAAQKVAPAATQLVGQKPALAAAQPVSAAASQGALEPAALQTALLEFLKQQSESHPEGVALQALYGHVESTPTDNVRKVLEKLVDDGEVFNTIDDEHFSVV